jgi:hypothetical protein
MWIFFLQHFTERIGNGSPSLLDIGNLVGQQSLIDNNHQRGVLEEALENEE